MSEIYSKWEIQPTSNKDPNITSGHPQFYSKSSIALQKNIRFLQAHIPNANFMPISSPLVEV